MTSKLKYNLKWNRTAYWGHQTPAVWLVMWVLLRVVLIYSWTRSCFYSLNTRTEIYIWIEFFEPFFALISLNLVIRVEIKAFFQCCLLRREKASPAWNILMHIILKIHCESNQSIWNCDKIEKKTEKPNRKRFFLKAQFPLLEHN